MLFPVYVHTGDDTHAHGAEVPDFPGCFSAADNWDALAGNIQEAVELHCEDEDMAVPAPTSLGKLMGSPDYQGGIWMMVDIDTGKLRTKSVRLNVSLPEGLLRRIDDEAKIRHMSRSAFLAMSAQRELGA
ncbi:type II toxin-antitoxin system HicB family antitoxin (plasmid) [Marinobacter sp. M3C]|jgi:predicted RNase H-like HicB family nuclease|uniref:type II toxin-antitoxin system HicB family antitoxin n=1 Tax=Marinobacter sp. M3C TaxID=2917715 RepID=UPI00200DE711|nr:type II toxin-antitoxin system HicB family antitoxin [Marinobacter sp. M3C]MCL1485158.1 type II toxin-antitoxin system HicB family antitoxin [Marinobacter sp.]UQG62817.1 type II toxin-antitoxin system HicB family antitoxin [Marinobacter sp. M3C]